MKEKRQINKEYYQRNKLQIREQQKSYRRLFPWILISVDINKRCNNPKNRAYKNYGGRGIKNLFKDANEIKFLWNRDNAILMSKPSLHRINNNGNYCIENCEFIEFKEHARFHRKMRPNNLRYEYKRI